VQLLQFSGTQCSILALLSLSQIRVFLDEIPDAAAQFLKSIVAILKSIITDHRNLIAVRESRGEVLLFPGCFVSKMMALAS
jgi:hypothetical protein